MLTKSLHTVTAAANVARYIFDSPTTAKRWAPRQLAKAALILLGYGDISTSEESAADDLTVARIVAACARITGAR